MQIFLNFKFEEHHFKKMSGWRKKIIQLFSWRDLRACLLFYLVTLKIFRCVCYCPYVCKVKFKNARENKEGTATIDFCIKKSTKQSVFSAILLLLHLVMGLLALSAEILIAYLFRHILTTTEQILNAMLFLACYLSCLMVNVMLLLNNSNFGKILQKQRKVLELIGQQSLNKAIKNVSQHFIFLLSLFVYLILMVMQFHIIYPIVEAFHNGDKKIVVVLIFETFSKMYIVAVYATLFAKVSASNSILIFGFKSTIAKFIEMETEMALVAKEHQSEDDLAGVCWNNDFLAQETFERIEEHSANTLTNSVQKSCSDTDRNSIHHWTKSKQSDAGKRTTERGLINVFDRHFHPSYEALVELSNYQMQMNDYFGVPLVIASKFVVFMTINLIFFGLIQLGGVAELVYTIIWMVPVGMPLVAVYCQADEIRTQVIPLTNLFLAAKQLSRL